MKVTRQGAFLVAIAFALVGCDTGSAPDSTGVLDRSSSTSSPRATTTSTFNSTITSRQIAPPSWTFLEVPFTTREGSSYATGGGWFFVWGGGVDRTDSLESDGLLVDVEAGFWVEVPEAPITPRFPASVVWTGDEFIVFGGHSFDESFIDGAAFNPSSDHWRVLPNAPVHSAAAPSAVWGGQHMVVWLAGTDSRFAEQPSSVAGQIAFYDPSTDRWRVASHPDVAVVDAELIIHNSQLVLVGGPGMRDQRGGLDRSLYASWFDGPTDSWSEPVLGPGTEAARLTTLSDGRLGVLITGGAICALERQGWKRLDVESPIDVGIEEGCWWDLGAASGGGETYLKVCGYDLVFDGPNRLVAIVEPADYGSTANLYASAFLADSAGRLLVFGDSDHSSGFPTATSVFGLYDKDR